LTEGEPEQIKSTTKTITTLGVTLVTITAGWLTSGAAVADDKTTKQILGIVGGMAIGAAAQNAFNRQRYNRWNQGYNRPGGYNNWNSGYNRPGGYYGPYNQWNNRPQYSGSNYPNYNNSGYGYQRGYAAPAPAAAANVLPGAAAATGPIKLSNPKKNSVALNYTLNGHSYSIQPGHSQALGAGSVWTIQFDRGGSFGQARYSLSSGTYTFKATDKGWDLYRKSN